MVGLKADVGMDILDGRGGLDTVLVGTPNGFQSPSVELPHPKTDDRHLSLGGGTHTISLNGRNRTRPLSLYARRGSTALIGIGIIYDEIGLVQRAFLAGGESLACRVDPGHLVCVFECG